MVQVQKKVRVAKIQVTRLMTSPGSPVRSNALRDDQHNMSARGMIMPDGLEVSRWGEQAACVRG